MFQTSNLSQDSASADIAALLENKGYKLIKGVVDDIDIGNVTASMVIRSGKRIVSMVLPIGEVKISGAEVGRPIYCLLKGKDVYVFRDIKYMMKRLLDK